MADLKEADLFESLEQQQQHWYYAAKIAEIGQIVQEYIEAHGQVKGEMRCLDIGAGNGIISRSIPSGAGLPTLRWDLVDSAYHGDQLGADPGNTSFHLYGRVPDGTAYDIVVAIDVVEHVEDDRAFLGMLASHMGPGGLLIVCVPAYQLLWSEHDVFLEHYRRYRRGALARLMTDAGFNIASSGYFYQLLFPPIALLRVLSRLRRGSAGSPPRRSDLRAYPPVINGALSALMRLERAFRKAFPWLTRLPGVSCVVVGSRI